MTDQLSAHQALQINSLAFIVFVAVAYLLFILGRRFQVQGPVLAALNLCFLYFFIQGLASQLFLLGLLAFTYLMAELRCRLSHRMSGGGFTIIVVVLWACLFLIKDPSFAGPLNPFHYTPIHLVGISFLMFRCINYVEDAELLPQRNPVTFLNFMLYFPTLIAGPIERYDNFVRHYETPAQLSRADVLSNLHRIVNGFIKKFVIADNLYPFTTFGNSGFEELSAPMLWIYVLLQLPVLYMDFSGYCDIVIGLSRLMGIPIMENFDKPYKARNIQEFWSRWHISLTSFIRDYVFTPLNRLAIMRLPSAWHFPAVAANYFFTMMLIALWHGTTWGFFIFGVIHGAVLVTIQLRKKYTTAFFRVIPGAGEAVISWGGWALNFVFISLTMVCWYFTPSETLSILARLVGVL